MRRKPDDQRDLFPGALEMMVLRALERRPMHGYALVQHVQQRSENLLQKPSGSFRSWAGASGYTARPRPVRRGSNMSWRALNPC